MQLSQALFAEITGVNLNAPASPGAPPCNGDRRVHRRVAFDHRARIFPLMEGVGEGGSAVLVRDISVVGVGFLYADPISVGDEFIVRLPTSAGEPIDIQCAARRCELSGTCGSQFAVGATFELVLNRSISSAIAPESEMLSEMVPDPATAEPSIEERYDQQRETSLLLRPIVHQTRMDRFLANPRVQRIHRVLKYIFWPIAVVYSAVHRLLAVTEDARIRNRLSSSKKSKWARAQKRSRPSSAADLLAKLPAAAESPAATTPPAPIPASGEVYTSLFELPGTNAAETKESPAQIASNSARVSLFATGEPVEIMQQQSIPPPIQTSPVPITAAPASEPDPTPTVAQSVVEIVSAPEPVSSELLAAEISSTSESPAEVSTENQSSPEASDSVVMRNEPPAAPAEAVVFRDDSVPANAVAVPSESQVVASAPQIESKPQPAPEPTSSKRSAPAPLKARPPSALSRRSRRRSRSGF